MGGWIEAFAAYFVIGSFWFYVVTVSFFVWDIFLVEKENVFWGGLSLLVYLLFLQFWAKLDVFGTASENPLISSITILLYFILGFAWSFIKWWLFVKESAEKCHVEMEKFFKGHEGELKNKREDDLKMNWERSFGHTKKPEFAYHKNKITMWIIYWPFSFVWSFINDFVKRVINQLIEKVKFLYQKITDKSFKDLDFNDQVMKRTKAAEEKKKNG